MGAAQVKGQLSRQAVLRLKMEFEVQKHRFNKTKNKCVQSLIQACPCCLKFQTRVSERNMKETFEDAIEGLEPFTELIAFDELDTWALYNHFCLVDDDLSNSVDIDEFFDYFGLEMTPFMVSAFNSFDVDEVDTEGHLTLDFGEFLAAIWNFCTFDHGQLVEFAFNIYDTEGDGAVDIKTLAEHVHNSTDVEGDLPDLMKSLTEFDADASGTIDFEEFRTAEKENRVFIQPAFDLQRTLRRKIEGSEFWIDATLRRHSKLGPSGINVMEYFTLIRDGKELPDIPIDDVRSIGIVTVGEDELECPGYKKTLIGSKCHHCKREVAVHPRPPPTVHEEPDSLSEVVEGRELKLNEKVEIYEHRLDRRESGKIWYLINKNGKEWVSQECVAIDYDWLRESAVAETERQRLARQQRREKKRKLEHEAAIRQLDETYDMLVDKASGRVYWLNKLTLESSYDDPYVAVGMKGTDRRREMQDKAEAETQRNSEKSESKNGSDGDNDPEARTRPFDIHFVQFQGNRFRLRQFAVDATVADVKKEIEEITDISVLDQRLFFRQTELDDLGAIVLNGPAGFVRGETLKFVTVAASKSPDFDEWLAIDVSTAKVKPKKKKKNSKTEEV